MAQTAATHSIQVVSFNLVNQKNGKKEDYAIPIEQVKEIRTIEEITQVPKAKSFIRGVMNLRGIIIPVMDVKDKLGFGKTEINQRSKQRILVADIENSLYGLLVDYVDQVLRIPLKEIGPAPSGTFDEINYVKGIAKTQNRLLVLLDVTYLISDSNISMNKSDIQNTQTTITKNEAQKKESVTDDIPAELLEVFNEDKTNAPSEINQKQPEQANTNTNNNFQAKVNEEMEKFRVNTLKS